MKAEVQKKYSICVEIEQERAGELVSIIDYFDRIRPDKGIGDYHTLFEFQKILIVKMNEISDMEMRD